MHSMLKYLWERESDQESIMSDFGESLSKK